MMHATFTDSKNRVACPASLEHGDLINSGQVHYASRRQIEKFGLCKKCRKRIKKHGKAILKGKVETPAEIEKHHFPTVEQDHAGFADGELVQAQEFDFAAVDEALGLVESTPPDARQQAGELVRQLFAYCFSQRKLDLRTAAAKLAVIGAGLRPDALDDKTQTELARQLGLTKAAMSKASVKFQDAFCIKFSRSRSVSARAKMRARRLGGLARHRKAAADGQSANQLGTSNQTVTCKPAEAGRQAEGGAVKKTVSPCGQAVVTDPLTFAMNDLKKR
jgi:hypothetical protein